MVEIINRNEKEANPDIKLRYGSTEASVSLDGAYVTRLSFDGQDILFPDGSYPINGKEKRRGGMPPMFPYAGPLENHPDWPQHGFARDMEWKDKTIYEDLEPQGILLELKSNEKTQKLFPYQFRDELEIVLGENGFSYKLIVFNEGTKDMPIAPGVHPYFCLPTGELSDIETNIKGLDLEDYQLTKTLFLPVQKEVEIKIPKIGGIKMLLGGDFLRDKAQLWFWTDSSNYDYFCVEPCSGPVGSFLKEDERILVPAGENKKFTMQLTLNNPSFE